MALKKTEDRVMLDRCLAHLAINPAENYFKAVKAVAQEFMLGDDLVVNNRKWTPQSKSLGTGVYQLSYKCVSINQIQV